MDTSILIRARFWIKTDRPSELRIEVFPAADRGNVISSIQAKSSATKDHCLQLEVGNLLPDEPYAYRLWVDGKPWRHSCKLEFRTTPPAGKPQSFNVVFGSCAFVNDPSTDTSVDSKPYGGDPQIFASMASLNPTMTIWLGDNVYYRPSDLKDPSLMRARYARGRALPELQNLLVQSAHYAIWDDHDYGSNDADHSFPGKDDSLAIFKSFWANPAYGNAEQKGCFFRLTRGDVDFFFTDNRFNRSPNKSTDNGSKTMFGRRQRRWLLESLRTSHATFKVVCFGNQFLNEICRFEGMAEFKTERKLILDAVKKDQISGLIFLSGDRHHSELIVKKNILSYPLYDFTCSPLLAGTYGPDEADNADRVANTYVTDIRNFGVLRFAGKKGARQLTLECRNTQGKLLWTKTLTAQHLSS